MKTNVGKIDKIIRIVVGVVLLLAPLLVASISYTSTVGIIAVVIGLVALVTGLMSSCPLYSVLGIKTTGKG